MPTPRSRIAAFVALALCAGVAAAQVGTPPQLRCGKTYVFSKAITNGNVLADQPSTVTVDTLHYINRISFQNACPTASPSVVMTANLECTADPSSGPTVFGPFTLTEGFTQIPITIPVPAGQVRECDVVVAARVTFADGSVLEQVADQRICVVEESPTMPGMPRLGVQLIDNNTQRVHPGDSRVLTFRVANYTDLAVEGCYSACMNNVADLPVLINGVNNASFGVFSVSDPGGGDRLPIVDHAPANPQGCIDLPGPPHTYTASLESGTFALGPGQSTDIQLDVRTYPLSPTGAMNEGTFRAAVSTREIDDTACAGFTVAADHTQTPGFKCTRNSGRVAIPNFNTDPAFGAVARLRADVTPAGTEPFDVNHAVDRANMQMHINGTPISGGNPNFSGLMNLDSPWYRLNGEFSFIVPLAAPNSIIQMTIPYVVRVAPPSAPTTQTMLHGLQVVPGAPNGFADSSPVIIGYFDVERTGSLADGCIGFIQQLDALGVENGTFNPVGMTNLGVDVTQTGPDSYTIVSTWTATNPGSTPFVGFDVFADTRAHAEPATDCSLGDMDGDGLVTFHDIDLFADALAGRITGPQSRCADLNGDGVLNLADVVVFVELLNE